MVMDTLPGCVASLDITCTFAVNHRGARRDDDTDEVYIGHKDIAPCRTCNPMGKVEMEFKDSVFHGAAWFD